MRKWLKKLSVLLLAICILLFLFLLFERVRGQIALARFISEIKANGETVSPADFNFTVSRGENGVPAIVQAVGQLKPGAILPDGVPQKMRLLPSGHAVVGFREEERAFEKETNSWAALAFEWDANQPALRQIRDALERPVLRSELDYSLGYNLLIPNLSSCKKLVIYFGAGSQYFLHNGRNREALDCLLTQIRLPHMIESDRLAISELVRIAVISFVKSATWEALQSEGWTDADLQKLQAAWESHQFINSAVAGFQGELVYEGASYKLLRNSNDDAFKVLFTWRNIFGDDSWEPPEWERQMSNLPFGNDIVKFLQKQIFCRVWRFAWSHQHELRSARQIYELLEITRSLAKTHSFISLNAALEQFTKEAERRTVYDAWRFPDTPSYLVLAKLINKSARAQVECSATICAIALLRFALRNGKYPDSLEFLVPSFLPAVPIDYFDGRAMKYFLNSDGRFTLYSVGEDGKDDHGDGSLNSGKIGRSVWDRKDAIWPTPATSEEVAVFRKTKSED